MFVKAERRSIRWLSLAVGALVFLVMLATAHAQGDSRRKLNVPVPGGVAILSLGKHAKPTTASYLGHPVLVVQDETQDWVALVGTSLNTAAGTEYLALRDESGQRKIAFRVGKKATQSNT
jgi:hypothetical protein